MPQFGATFYPGGVDDYYMPEVIAPAPQRIMPEVPENMQQGLQRMELEAHSVEPKKTAGSPEPQTRHGREPSLSTVLNTKVGGYGSQYSQQATRSNTDYSVASATTYTSSVYSAHPETESPKIDSSRDKGGVPSFSPFPVEKEAVLAESRQFVLHSNDPNMQICWARDVLMYVEIAAEAAAREADAVRAPGDRSSSERPATPKIEHELRVDAINIVSYLADQGHPEAVFIRSKWWEFGKFGKRQDKKEAYSGYAMAAQQGWGRADYRIGMLYENSNDVENAMKHYRLGQAANDSAASYRLGMVNLMGQRGQPRDLVRGLDLIHTAADTADEDAPQGAFVYGMLIARDLPDVAVPDGVLPLDLGLAKQYIEKAAYLGFAKAQLKMGQAYELCQLACEFNPALSLHYYGLAAKQGLPEACLGVSRWFLFGYEGSFAKNEQLAFKYAQLAAKAGLATGEFAMGYYYEIGISVDKNITEARKWYELAADHGNKDAVGRLDGLSQSKTLSKQDHETTALGRIKSKHGSQRGQRPERFKQVGGAMPTLSESSPRASPQPSPQARPTENHMDFPDPARHENPKGPAFALNIADRPGSAAPYPEDRPVPGGLALRPKSAAPYPEDDVRRPASYGGQLRPHLNAGPIADRPGSAFGIRTQSPGRGGPPMGPGMRPSQSAGQLPLPSAGVDPNRGRPVSAAQGPPGGYGQPGPRPATTQPPSSQRPPQPGPGPMQGNPGQGRKPLPPGQGLPGRDVGPGPRNPNYGPGGGPGGPGGPHGPGPHGPGRASAGPPGPGPQSPAMSGGLGGPPGRLPAGPDGRTGTPQSRPPISSPAPSTSTQGSTATMRPPASGTSTPAKQGPATFEAMGIPKAKKEDDCVCV
ncbi:LOW QUALITY PROTEIN: uncharacterized protein B0I36DRAFT_335461 [Microdochium trichocladiopsis]|uniref:Chitin synthase activator n=1 Tax=Microdochium trichocladiopsis TaxID=1682393 RepID=A0A9P8XXA6_9PEZI|nr:LOW QUALITY PROTEIN: uncharacterized protein B0I36DRAFT_335461 [Microdochium trichocladiopsis]KAH7018192.1 LOW QUALITY PROTEIN: hypothetical protein B0I36DRAFT_335461 [Microdochium trichocladiopsis]